MIVEDNQPINRRSSDISYHELAILLEARRYRQREGPNTAIEEKLLPFGFDLQCCRVGFARGIVVARAAVGLEVGRDFRGEFYILPLNQLVRKSFRRCLRVALRD